MRVEPVISARETFKKLQRSLLMFYTGQQRSADGCLHKQRQAVQNGRAVDALIRMRDLAYEFRDRLAHGEIDALGGLLDENWRLKRGLADGISSSAIDGWYERARAAGALGGKILGAGAGASFFSSHLPRNRTQSARRFQSCGSCHFDSRRTGPRSRCSERTSPRAMALQDVETLENVESYLGRLHAAVDALPTDRLAELGEIFYRTYRNGQQVFTLGNGGSASTASHMAADLGKNTCGPNMRRFRILSLNDNQALLTALANDLGYENVFSEQLKNLIRPAIC